MNYKSISSTILQKYCRLNTNSVGEDRQIENSNSIIGRRIDYNLNDNVFNSKSSTNLKKFPMMIETGDKRINRQNIRLFPNTVKNPAHLYEENHMIDQNGQKLVQQFNEPHIISGRNSRINTLPSHNQDNYQTTILKQSSLQSSENIRKNDNNLIQTNKKYISNKPSSSNSSVKPKKQILLSTLQSPISKTLHQSDSQHIKTIYASSTKHLHHLHSQPQTAKKSTKKKIQINKKQYNDENKLKEDKIKENKGNQNDYQVNADRKGKTENSLSPHSKKSHSKKRIKKNVTQSQDYINVKLEQQPHQQQSNSQVQNGQKEVQSSKNTLRSCHSPIDSPKKQNYKCQSSNGSSSNLNKRNTNSQLSKRKDSEVFKEQVNKEINQQQDEKREKLQKIKSLIDENIKKAQFQKQQKIEEKKNEDDLKKEKQMQMLQKNQLIRHINASRFSRNKVNTNDLSKRLPWGINQEKLRNYAIQVLIQYRNQDQRSQSENVLQKQAIQQFIIIQQHISKLNRQDDTMRRKVIGLDKLSEDEIQRLISVNKEKMKEQEEDLNHHHMLSIQKREQHDQKKEEVLQYMEYKKQKIEREQSMKKQQKFEEELHNMNKKLHLEENVKKIFKRLKKQSQYLSKSKNQSNKFHIPINQLQQNSLYKQQNSKNTQMLHSNTNLASPSQDNLQYQFKTEENFNNDSDSKLKSRYIKTEEGSTYQIQNAGLPLYINNLVQQTTPFKQAFLSSQLSSQYPFQVTQQDNNSVEEDDYSVLYDQFKQLITGQDNHYFQDMYRSPQCIQTQTSSQKNPSFYKTSASSQKNFNTQTSAIISKMLKKKSPQKSGKKSKRKGANTDGSEKKKKKQKQQLSNQQHESDIYPQNEISGSMNIQNTSKINQIQVTKQKYDDLSKRFNQIKLNTSKNDSMSNNTLTKTNKQLAINGQIEEKTESEDYESSRKEYEINNFNQITHQLHQQYQFEQPINQVYNNGIGQIIDTDQFSSSPISSNPYAQNRLSQQKNNEVIDDSQAKNFIESISDKLAAQQEDSSGSVIIKDSDLKPDQMLEDNLLQNNQIFYQQLELQNMQFEDGTNNNIYQQDYKQNIPQNEQNLQQIKQESVQNKSQNSEAEKQYQSGLQTHENEYKQNNQFNIHNQQTDLSFNVGDEELDEQDQIEQKQYYRQQQQMQQKQQQQEYNQYDDGQEDEEEMNEEQLELLAQQIFNNAATYIQKIWRGYFTRKILTYYLEILENGEIDENGNFIEAQNMVQEEYEEEEEEDLNAKEYQKYAEMNQQQQKGSKSLDYQNVNQNNNIKQEKVQKGIQNNQINPQQNLHQGQQQQQQNQIQQEQKLNKEWLMKQEKEELLQHGNPIEDEEEQFDFQGNQGNIEKFVHISTIKSSVISHDEGQLSKNEAAQQNQDINQQSKKSTFQNQSDKKLQQQSQDNEEYEDYIEAKDEYDQNEEYQQNAQNELEYFMNQMNEEDLENWNEVSERINALTQSNDYDIKDKIIEILQELTPLNRDRLLLCIEDNEDDSNNFSIEQIEAVFRNHPQSQYQSTEQKDYKNIQAEAIPYNQVEPKQTETSPSKQGASQQNPKSNEQNKKNLKNNQLQIDIQTIEEDEKNNSKNIQSKLENKRPLNNQMKNDEKKQLSDNNASNDSNTIEQNSQNNKNMNDYYTKTHQIPTKSSDRLSGQKNSSAKREKSHSSNYEALSERSFNQMRRNKLHSPKDQRLSLRNALSVQSDDARSIEAVSPKEELNQLFALLQQEQMQQKKDRAPKNLSQKSGSLKGSARNINKDLQQEMLYEYFESSQSQENPLSNNQDKLNNNSSSSIFDKDSFKEFTEKKLKQIMNEENINDILKMREQALEMRHTSQMNAMNQMLSENHVSPRTYDNKKIELETWVKREKEEITQTRKALERGLLKAYESIKKTQRDVQLAQRYKHNPSKFDSRSSFASEEEYLFRKKFEHEGGSIKSDSDTHSDNLSSSQGLKYLLKEVGTPTSKNNIKIIDKFEIKQKSEGESESKIQDDQEKKGKKDNISKKHNKRYADGDNDEYQDDYNIEGEENDVEKQMKINLNDKKNSQQQKGNKQNQNNQDNSPTQKSPQSNKKSNINKQGVQLVLDYNDFDIASANNGGEQSQNLRIPTLSSSNESLSFQQQNLDRLINEKIITVKKDGSQSGKSKKSPKFEENAFPFSPLSDASKETHQFNNSAAAPGSEQVQHSQQSEDSAAVKESPNKKSPRDILNLQKESNSEEDEIEQLKFYEDKEFLERNVAFQQLSQPSAEFMERNEILTEMQERWKTYNQIDTRIQEQLQKLFALDKSECYGIPTNIKIITDYIDRIFQYVAGKFN